MLDVVVGLIVNEYLKSSSAPFEFCDKLKLKAKEFNGFQFLSMYR